MAELADALDSGSSEGDFMQVQVLLSAPKEDMGTSHLNAIKALNGQLLRIGDGTEYEPSRD